MTPLHHIGSFFRELLLQIPLSVVRAGFLLLIALLLVWVLSLPKHQAEPEGGAKRLTENLKLWAAAALLLQLLIYSLL